MHIFLTKKIALADAGVKLRSLAWDGSGAGSGGGPSAGWLVAGGDGGALELRRLTPVAGAGAATSAGGVRGIAAPTHIAASASLASHKGARAPDNPANERARVAR